MLNIVFWAVEKNLSNKNSKFMQVLIAGFSAFRNTVIWHCYVIYFVTMIGEIAVRIPHCTGLLDAINCTINY
jgi:hypothetical protein